MTGNLATFDNAWRVAASMADDHDRDYALVRTGDPGRPYIVEESAGQSGTVAVLCADPETAMRWTHRARSHSD